MESKKNFRKYFFATFFFHNYEQHSTVLKLLFISHTCESGKKKWQPLAVSTEPGSKTTITTCFVPSN